MKRSDLAHARGVREDRVYSAKQAMRILGIKTAKTMRSKLSKGEIRGHNSTYGWRIYGSDLIDYLVETYNGKVVDDRDNDCELFVLPETD